MYSKVVEIRTWLTKCNFMTSALSIQQFQIPPICEQPDITLAIVTSFGATLKSWWCKNFHYFNPPIILWQTQNHGGERDASSVRHFVQQLAGLSNSRSSSYPNNIMLQPTESSLEHGSNNKLPSVRRSHLTYILIKLLRMKVLDSNPDLEIIYRKAYAKWTPVLKILARWTMRHNYHCLSFYLQ